MREYLVKVRFALSGLSVFKIKTDNIYRIVGKIFSTSIEHIERIDYSRHTPEREQFWIDEGYKINGYTEPVLSEDQSTADVAKVKHGEWFSLTECSNAGVYCSVCHKKVYKEDYAWCSKRNKLRSNYCPNCGAKMDGGKAE